MLAAIRRFAKSWFAAVLIGLLIVSFAVFGIRDVFKRVPTNDVIKAGSHKVSMADFKREFETYRKQAEQQVGQPVSTELAVENGLDKRLLTQLADREALAELVKKIGIIPSDALLRGELRKIPAFFDSVSGRFDKKLYQQRLAENELTPETFEARLKTEIAQSHLVSAIQNGFAVPRAYSALAAIYGLEARDVGYFAIDPRMVPPPALPTDAQLSAFMKEHSAQLTRPEQRILTVVVFNPAQVSANLPVSQADLEKRFQFRKDTLSQPETRSVLQIPAKDAAAATAIAARLAKGEDPAAVAKSLGVDAISYVDKPKTAIVDHRVAEAAFSLPAGQVSGPIQGDLGFAVVKVVKVTPGHAVTLEDIRPQLEAEIRKDAAAEKVYELTQAYDDAHSGGASLTEAAQKAGVPAVTLGPVSKEGRGPTGEPVQGVNQKLLDTAFALPQGGESEVEEAGGGVYYAVRVDRVVPAAMPPLAEVKPQLTRVWMQQEMIKRLQAKADELAARVKKGESLEAVASSIGASVARVVGLDRQSAGQNQSLSRDALGKTFTVKPGEVFTAEHTTFGIIVAKLEAVRPPSGPNLARMTEDGRPQMAQGLFTELGESAQKSARAQIKVAINGDRARAALGLEPLEKGKDGKPAKPKSKAETEQ